MIMERHQRGDKRGGKGRKLERHSKEEEEGRQRGEGRRGMEEEEKKTEKDEEKGEMIIRLKKRGWKKR